MRSILISSGGNTTVWTPAAGKRFQLLGWQFGCGDPCIATGNCYANIRDGATIICKAGSFSKTNVSMNYSATLPGDGYISVADNNPLIVDVDATITAGFLTISVWGYEI